jgi:hypothetical protein
MNHELPVLLGDLAELLEMSWTCWKSTNGLLRFGARDSKEYNVDPRNMNVQEIVKGLPPQVLKQVDVRRGCSTISDQTVGLKHNGWNV